MPIPQVPIKLALLMLASLLSHSLVATEIKPTPDTATTNPITRSHAIAMHGDLKYPANFRHFQYANPNAPKGGRIKRSAIGTFDSLNPFIAKGNADGHVGLIYDSLMSQSADEAFSMYGLVAESVEYPKDRSWIIFHINPKAQFHDGVAIKASDVVFSFNILMEKGSPQYQQYFAGVDRVEPLDRQRVKFSFKPGDNHELALIVGSISVLPEHHWQNKDFSKSSLDIPLGSGPYKIKQLEAGRFIVFERAKNYWAKSLAVNKGLYNFDEIRFDYYRDRNVELEAFKAGEYDIRVEYTSKSWATEYTGRNFDNGRIQKQELTDHTPQGLQAFIVNLRRKPFNDPAFRRAMVLAFDFEWSNRNLFYGAYSRAYSYFTNSELAATGLPSGRELEILNSHRDQLSPAVFNQAYTIPATDGSGRDRQNLITAQALLKDAGYQIIDGKLHAPNTDSPIAMEFLTFSPQFERIINPYIHNLKKLGVTAQLRIVDTSQYVNRLREFDFDITTLRRGQSQSPGNEQRNMWTCQAAKTKSSANYSGICDPVIDQLVEGIISAPNREELVAQTKALDRVLLHHNYAVPQWYNQNHRIAYWNKFSRPPISAAFDSAFEVNLSTWWLDKDKLNRLTTP